MITTTPARARCRWATGTPPRVQPIARATDCTIAPAVNWSAMRSCLCQRLPHRAGHRLERDPVERRRPVEDRRAQARFPVAAQLRDDRVHRTDERRTRGRSAAPRRAGIAWCRRMPARTSTASSRVGRMHGAARPAVRSMAAGSRPTASQCPSRIPFRRRKDSGSSWSAFQMSPYSATIRSVRFSPLPPIAIGRRVWTGEGSFRASLALNHSPSWVTDHPSSSPRQIAAASASRSRRRPTGGNAYPNASCSRSNQPAPRPSTARPPVAWSRAVAIFASSPGFR